MSERDGLAARVKQMRRTAAINDPQPDAELTDEERRQNPPRPASPKRRS